MCLPFENGTIAGHCITMCLLFEDGTIARHCFIMCFFFKDKTFTGCWMLVSFSCSQFGLLHVDGGGDSVIEHFLDASELQLQLVWTITC